MLRCFSYDIFLQASMCGSACSLLLLCALPPPLHTEALQVLPPAPPPNIFSFYLHDLPLLHIEAIQVFLPASPLMIPQWHHSRFHFTTPLFIILPPSTQDWMSSMYWLSHSLFKFFLSFALNFLLLPGCFTWRCPWHFHTGIGQPSYLKADYVGSRFRPISITYHIFTIYTGTEQPSYLRAD